MFGPGEAGAITLIKDLVHLLSTTTAGVGEFADFLILSSFAVVVALVYRRYKNKKGAGISLVCGSVVMAIMGGLTNKFILIPFYSKTFMPIEAIIDVCQKINPMIDSVNAYVLFGAVPFNIIKGILISFFTLLVYKKLSVIIKSRI